MRCRLCGFIWIPMIWHSSKEKQYLYPHWQILPTTEFRTCPNCHSKGNKEWQGLEEK